MKAKTTLIVLIINALLFGEDINITGKVVNKQGTPVSGVTVWLVKNGDSAVTDNNGEFTIIGIVPINPYFIKSNKSISYLKYSHTTGILSFTVTDNNQHVLIDILRSNGRKIDCVLNKKFTKGTFHIRPLNRVTHNLGSSVYFIKFISGNIHHVFKTVHIKDKPYISLQQNSKEQTSISRKADFRDTLRFLKDGFQIKDIALQSYIIDIGSVIIMQYPVCEITLPKDSEEFDFCDSITITVNASDNDGSIASVAFYVDDELQYTVNNQPYTYTWNTIKNTIGTRSLKVGAEDNDGLIKIDSIKINVTADSVKMFTYNKINTYSHDTEAYTQGLVYEDGVLYEGTGKKGNSSLRKVELETGEVLKIHNLASDYFGEGIVIYEDKIIQLTWHEFIAFVYNKETFNVLDTFEYQTQGWGITHNNKHFIMSDGSSCLYLLDFETYTEIGKVDVKENDNSLVSLNELEFFYNKVFANIYSTDSIAMIDLESGKVIGKIDCKGLLDSVEVNRAGVLNGIAYDKDNDRIFVTGKYWPKLFEIKLIPVD